MIAIGFNAKILVGILTGLRNRVAQAWCSGGRLLSCYPTACVAVLLLSGGNMAANEFELRGYYEVSRRTAGSPEPVQKLRELAERMYPGEKTPKITKEVIEAFQKAGGPNLLVEDSLYSEAELRREFTFYVRGKAWLAECYAPNSPSKYRWEIGSTGDGQVFSTGRSDAYGSKQGAARARPLVPHSVEESGVPLLWLFALGADYLKAVTNEMVWPMHVLYYHAEAAGLDKREQATWEVVDWGKHTWVKRLAFPGAQGWTNAFYEVRGWTNEGRLHYPREFYVETRTQPRMTQAGKIIQPLRRWSFTITNAVATCNRKNLLPTAYPGMTVVDMRVKQPAAYANNTNRVRKAYQLTEGKWETSVPRAQAKMDGRPYRPWWHWVLGSVAAVVLLSSAVTWLRWRARPCVPPRWQPPPADAPSP